MYHIRLSLLHALALFQWIFLDISVYNFTGKKDLNCFVSEKRLMVVCAKGSVADLELD